MAARFYITDAEILTPAGSGVEVNSSRLFQNKSYLSLWDNRYIGKISDSVEGHLSTLSLLKHLKNQDRATLMAIYLSQKLAQRNHLQDSYGVIAGSSRGLTSSLEVAYNQFLSDQRLSPVTSPVTTSSAIPAAIARELDLQGPLSYLSAACSTSMIALIHACANINLGLTTGFLVGGVEASLTPFTLAMLESAKVLSKSMNENFPCQPMGDLRNGMVLSEGGGLILLEASPSYRPVGEIVGWAIKTERSTLTGISTEAQVLQEAIKRCVDVAGISFADIDLIVGHGSGTAKGDSAEAYAYDQLFQKQVPRVFHKWLFGHMLGGSAIVSLALGLKHLEEGRAPGHPYFPEDHNMRSCIHLARNRYLLVSSLGFGGVAACVIVKNMRS